MLVFSVLFSWKNTTCIIYAFTVGLRHKQLFIKNFKHKPSSIFSHGTAPVTFGTPSTLLFFMSPVSFLTHCSVLVFCQLRPGLWVRWLSASISSTLRVPRVPSCFYIFNTKPFYTLKPDYTHSLSEKWQGEL